ncbi:MAG: thioredoxin fold domain-containing protein [Immundisolibacteraceae bacterium]|nr:thioredoxin fold domain-containing protein [Immundisolibacteraceae bacterium]
MTVRFNLTNKTILVTAMLCMLSGILNADEIPWLVKDRLNKSLEGYQATEITLAPIPGWYQGQVGPRLLYISADGRFLMDGQLIDLAARENLTENALMQFRRGVIDGVDQSSMITFNAPEQRHVITVFTDIDCGYCRKLHSAMDDYHKFGISVRYLAYPRAGIGSGSYRLMESAWCADDKASALTNAKRGKQIDSLTCDSPVASHYQIGHDLGVTGTPAILLESGKMLPGFVDAERLYELLERQKTS